MYTQTRTTVGDAAFYARQIARKRVWEPVCGPATPVTPGAEETIGRCLCLRHLELDVQSWVNATRFTPDLPVVPEALRCLELAAEEEQNHDKVLNLAAEKFASLISPQDEQTALQLRQAWVEHPDHPIVKAGVLESSVFFVLLPLLRLLSGSATLRVISNDISNDETRHAAQNRQLAADLGYSWSPSLDRLRRDTVAWMVDKLQMPQHRLGQPEVWLQASDSLLERLEAPQLQDTRRPSYVAFFEQANSGLPIYR
jgi:hypothetical protein